MYRSRTSPWHPRPTSFFVFPKKWIPVASFLTVAFVVWVFKPWLPVPTLTWEFPADRYLVEEIVVPQNTSRTNSSVVIVPNIAQSEAERQRTLRVQAFGPGTPQPVGYQYTKTLVVPKTTEDDTDWIQENFGESDSITHAIYEVDNMNATLHPPKNKGHEVMVYLSYIIDHYNNLSDVNIFMHSHRYAWHNNELLDLDAAQMVSRLSAERVQREGYMNMRCSWEPGCPSWMHPGTIEEDINKQEETMLAKSWSELFPLDPIPYTLAQPCCAQFAISRDRIRSLPLARYVYYRDWLLRTQLSDYISGRVWEYVWQFVFTGQNIVCPIEHICLCDGFGVCFGGEEEFNHYDQKNKERVQAEEDLETWQKDNERWKAIKDLSDEEREEEDRGKEVPEIGRDLELQGRISALRAWLEHRKQRAKEYGDVAMNRAKEAGRPWKDGDGF